MSTLSLTYEQDVFTITSYEHPACTLHSTYMHPTPRFPVRPAIRCTPLTSPPSNPSLSCSSCHPMHTSYVPAREPLARAASFHPAGRPRTNSPSSRTRTLCSSLRSTSAASQSARTTGSTWRGSHRRCAPPATARPASASGCQRRSCPHSSSSGPSRWTPRLRGKWPARSPSWRSGNGRPSVFWASWANSQAMWDKSSAASPSIRNSVMPVAQL
ncbi:hypothetical protein T492DRAFT_1015092 [Pavlovales sp. CCMP2436]|nr:hypothetical protein T492DRAFT_1015092 [Pavlovales sp. CCMP2436]